MCIKFRRGLFLAAAIALIAGAGSAFAAVQPSCLDMSASLLENLQKGDFKAATARFDERMKAGLSARKLEQVWRQALPQQLGAFKQAATAKSTPKGPSTTVITPLRFANGWLNMLVSCNTQHHIQGLFFRPGSAPSGATTKAPASTTAWITRAAVGAKTLPITVQRNDFALKGVLDLPAGKGPFGVVDIIPGSGPVSINGDAGPIQYSPYKKLAAALVGAGWAVARVAKRGMPPSTGNGNAIIFSDQVADNLAIVKALRKNPHIKSNRFVVAGHSLGGLIGPKLATETHLAGLILLEAPGESLAKTLTMQRTEIAQKAGASATRIAAFKEKLTKLHRLVINAPPGRTVSYEGITPIGNAPDVVQLLKSLFEQKPIVTARKVKIPVLVVQGGEDTQVPPENGKRLIEALPHGKLLYIRDMNHDLSVARCRCEKDTGKNATLAPGLTAGIVRWLQSL